MELLQLFGKIFSQILTLYMYDGKLSMTVRLNLDGLTALTSTADENMSETCLPGSSLFASRKS